jgi:hypothetical protein
LSGSLKQRFRSHSGLKNPAPTTQVFEGQTGPIGKRKFGYTVATQPRLKTTTGSNKNPLDLEIFLLSDQPMTSLVKRNSAQSVASAGQ